MRKHFFITSEAYGVMIIDLSFLHDKEALIKFRPVTLYATFCIPNIASNT